MDKLLAGWGGGSIRTNTGRLATINRRKTFPLLVDGIMDKESLVILATLS